MNYLQRFYKALKQSSLESTITFDERIKVISVPIFISDFNLLRCDLDNFIFQVLYLSKIKLQYTHGSLWKI